MPKVFLSYNSIVSPLGFDSKTVVEAIEKGEIGVKTVLDLSRFKQPFFGALINDELLESSKFTSNDGFTRLEKMMILSLKPIVGTSNVTINESVGLIISTTKGNIDVLDASSNFPENRAYLSSLGQVIKDYFGFKKEPIIVSNACVSGLLAISLAKRYIVEGIFNHVFIVSGDVISEFVVSGFNSFQAMSGEPCKPYSINRSGINLGEASASILVTSSEKKLAKESVEILGDSTCNDANHISGPSRTGEGLYRSIKRAMEDAQISIGDIDYISAHGTATPFNDEMEAVALDRLLLNHVPLNSLKGYFGHTLGASGLLETIVGMHSLHKNRLIPSAGFDVLGVSKAINVISKPIKKDLNIFLKTASGFGGCNTAALFKKVNL